MLRNAAQEEHLNATRRGRGTSDVTWLGEQSLFARLNRQRCHPRHCCTGSVVSRLSRLQLPVSL